METVLAFRPGGVFPPGESWTAETMPEPGDTREPWPGGPVHSGFDGPP